MFFETVYRWFIGLFGSPLAELLSGYDSATETVQGANQFASIGMVTLAIALVFMLLYYYVFNHPRFNRWWSWLIVLVLTGITNLFAGFGWTFKYSKMANVDATDFVYAVNCWGFGFANFIVSALWFILFSLAFKWWSRNCKYSPF